MAKSLAQFVTDIRAYIGKGKLKAARKSLDKAQKSGHRASQLKEPLLEIELAEGGGAAAAETLRDLAKNAEPRLPAVVKLVDAHLRRTRDDHAVRDALWEICLEKGQAELALRHLNALLQAGGIEPSERAQSLLARKDAVGATGIFILASLGAVKTDRIKLADRLLQNDQGSRTLNEATEALYAAGNQDGAIHYVLAQLAQRSGDRDRFLDHAGKAFEENPTELWTWTLDNVDAAERLEIALHNGSLPHLLDAAGASKPDELIAVAKRSKGEGTAARALRGLALLAQRKTPNACRIMEAVVQEDEAAAATLADFLRRTTGVWKGTREVYAAVVGVAFAGDRDQVDSAIAAILDGNAERGEAWGRVAPRLLEAAPDHGELRSDLGLYLISEGDAEGAAKLLAAEEHLAVAKDWAEAGHAPSPVLLAAARLAEEHDAIPQHADWMLQAASGDQKLVAELGRLLSSGNLSADTALQSAVALLEQDQKEQAGQMMAGLPLDPKTGAQVDELLRTRRLMDDRAFKTVSLRAALALGDSNRARRLFKGDSSNVQALAQEAVRYADAGRVLADVLIGQGKGEVAAPLLEARRDAGDDAKTLLPLADALLKASPKLAMGRLVRARLLHALERDKDAVRDLRAIPADAAELDDAFKLLGELTEGPAGGPARLGRADIHLARKQYSEAVRELEQSDVAATERHERYERICRERLDLDAGHRGRAECLVELDRIPDAADAHLKRFHCSDANPSVVASDLETIARRSLEAGDLATASRILEGLPEHVSDGAERAIAVIGSDERAPMLILRSQQLLQLGRAPEAVEALRALVRADSGSRPQAAKALEAIVEAGQARPDADFALAQAYESMSQTPRALKTLDRLYREDVTSKQNVVRAAQELVRDGDDPDVRLFLGRVCLDMRDATGATENAVNARRLRPEARRDCVDLLQRALDLDAFAPATHFALAEAHLAGDEADDAVRHFRAAVEVDKLRANAAITAMEEAAPHSKRPALLWLAVGTTHAEFMKDHASAVTAFTKGLDANPTTELRVPLLLGRGDAYAALREDDHAFDDFDEASRHDLLERRYYEFLRGRHRRRMLEAAEAARAKCTESFAHAAEACGRFIRLGRTGEAVQVAQAARASAAQELGPLYLVGMALHAAGSYDAAAQVLETVRASAGADTEIGRAARMLLAESYLDNGDRGIARACLTEIEALDALYPGLRARRASLAPPADDPLAPPPLVIRPEFPRPSE